MERRAFVRGLGSALLAIPVVHLVACITPEEDLVERPGVLVPPSGGAGGDTTFDIHNSDDSGHLHTFTIKCSHRDANGWVYTATGPHTHEVTISASEMDAIFRGEEVTIQTTTPHTHTWRIHLPNAVLCDGGDSGSDPGDPGGTPGDGSDQESFSVGNDDDSGHSHTFAIACVDNDGRARVYIAGGPHTHEIEVSAAELRKVFEGGTVLIDTSDRHPHTWLLRAPSRACE
jgi:hypothetical protein